MASAYAATVSLMNVLIRVQHPTCPATFDKSQIKALFNRVCVLVDFLEAHSQSISKDLQRRITDAANAAQDRIESYVVVRIRERRNHVRVDHRTRYVTLDLLEKDIQHIDLINIQVAAVLKQNRDANSQLPRRAVQVVTSQPPSGPLKFEGFQEEVDRLLDQLVADKSSREIVSVVGMGGIGKSTLAVSVYNHPYVRDAFDVKAWVTLSQVYDIETTIRHLLNDFGVSETHDKLLGERLHKYLFGRKYLIILDDIWDSQALDGISRFLPDNYNRSRVLLTTRILDVARRVGSCNPFEMQLLHDEKSWDLLSKVVFGHEVCPPELEKCGKEIAKSCKGLPLSLAVIGGMLKMSDITMEYWAYVAENISSIICREGDEQCLNILSLSYQELPIHLKPCFLYMASFPEDYEIRVSEIILLWAADGFIKPEMDNGNTMEDVALEYLDELVNRSIIIVKKRDSRGRMKHLILHDLVRDLCIRETRAERFLFADKGAIDSPEVIESMRRLAGHGDYHGSRFLPSLEKRGLIQSFLWFRRSEVPPSMSWLSLLRVLFFPYIIRSFGLTIGYRPQEITRLANLRFIKDSTGNICYVPSVSLLWNLETLIVDMMFESQHIECLPREIWKLPHIKHLIFAIESHLPPVIMPDPPTAGSVFINMQTLKRVKILSNKVLYRIPNMKDLGISFDRVLEVNLVHCHKLEKLYLNGRIRFVSNKLNTIKLFPDSLKKLTLFQCGMPWERMTIVGSLPNLEVLKLKKDAFVGKVWNSIEGEFQSLKVLSLVSNYLETWTIDNCSHFPCLERLNLVQMWYLEELPQVFEESVTLKSIRLEHCKPSLYRSAKQILDEQESTGNYDLTVEAFCPPVDMVNEKQKGELESMQSDRFHVQYF